MHTHKPAPLRLTLEQAGQLQHDYNRALKRIEHLEALNKQLARKARAASGPIACANSHRLVLIMELQRELMA